jgi:transposase
MAHINNLSNGSNYSLTKGRPFKQDNRSWNNYDRIVAAGRVMKGESFTQVAHDVGCCVQSVKNWIRTLNENNPRLEDQK